MAVLRVAETRAVGPQSQASDIHRHVSVRGCEPHQLQPTTNNWVYPLSGGGRAVGSEGGGGGSTDLYTHAYCWAAAFGFVRRAELQLQEAPAKAAWAPYAGLGGRGAGPPWGVGGGGGQCGSAQKEAHCPLSPCSAIPTAHSPLQCGSVLEEAACPLPLATISSGPGA